MKMDLIKTFGKAFKRSYKIIALHPKGETVIENLELNKKGSWVKMKFGKPCKKCKGYHNSIQTSGSNVASGSRKERCDRS